jgi:hypothetical protein
MLAGSINQDAGTVALSLCSGDHAIGLTYNPKNERWCFMDSNQGLPEELRIEDVAEKVIHGFYSRYGGMYSYKYVAISTKVITAYESLKCEHLRVELQAFKEQYHKLYPLEQLIKRGW